MEQIGRKNRSDGVEECTGSEINRNNNNIGLVEAIICAGLYPNVIRVALPSRQVQRHINGSILKAVAPKDVLYFIRNREIQDEKETKNKTIGTDTFRPFVYRRVFMHPSSVFFQETFTSCCYLMYHTIVSTSKDFVREASLVCLLLLF